METRDLNILNTFRLALLFDYLFISFRCLPGLTLAEPLGFPLQSIILTSRATLLETGQLKTGYSYHFTLGLLVCVR